MHYSNFVFNNRELTTIKKQRIEQTLNIEVSRRTLSRSRGRSKIFNDMITALFAEVKDEIDPGKVEGTDLRIVKYPHPSLRKQNVEITPEEIKDGTISRIAREMFLVMYAAQGIGLAAPQVGINKRLMIYNESGDPKKWIDEVILVNPKIVERSESVDIETEGCLSFPGMNGDVERPKWIKVEAFSATGKKIKKKYSGWEARIFQHEYDHLDGIVYIDRLVPESKQSVQTRLNELIAEYGEGGVL